MINLFIVILDYSGARTYANELIEYLSQVDSIILHKIYYESIYYKEYTIKRENNITEVHLPQTKITKNSLEKYSARCLDLMSPLISGKKNIIFHLNAHIHVKLGIQVRKRFGAKIIYTLHFLPEYFSYYGFDDNWQGIIESNGDTHVREMINEANQVICVTRFAKEAICRYYQTPPPKVAAIHNGYSSFYDGLTRYGESQTTVRKRLGFDKKEKIILFVGLMDPRKSLNTLIKAIKQLAGKFSDARLVIAGDGDFNDTLSNVNGCWSKITFLGKIPHNKLEDFYKIATIGVIPSVFEQCSYVALEMMKYGLPVVVTAAPGLRELYIDNENALVVPLHKADNGRLKLELYDNELTEAISKLLSNKQLLQKLSINTRLNWVQSYTNDQMGKATLNCYDRLLLQTNPE